MLWLAGALIGHASVRESATACSSSQYVNYTVYTTATGTRYLPAAIAAKLQLLA
jgi:hypothetical protein